MINALHIRSKQLPLLLITAVVMTGFVLMVIRHHGHTEDLKRLDGKEHNATAKMVLGQTIIENLHICQNRFHAYQVTSDPHEQQRLKQQAFLALDEINSALDVASDGGALKRQVHLNIPGVDETVLTVTYQPETSQTYNLEALTLRPQVVELREKLTQLFDQRGGDRHRLTKKIDSLLVRMTENANKFTYDAQVDLHRLHQQLNAVAAHNMQIELLWAVIIPGLVLLLIFLIYKQILATRQTLETTVAQLQETQHDLQEKNDLIGALNESLEQQVITRTKKLKLSEQQWREAFDAVRSPMFLHDSEGRLIKANQAYHELAPEGGEVIGRLYWEVFPRLDGPVPGCSDSPSAVCAVDTDLLVENRVYRSRSFAVHSDGHSPYSLHLMEDVTDMYQLTQLLQEKERQFRALFEQAPVAYMALDPQGRIVEVNEAWQEMMGYDRTAVLNRAFVELVAKPEQERLSQWCGRLVDHERLKAETLTLVTAHHAEIQASIDARMTYDDQGGPLQTHFILVDITQKLQQEASVRLSAKVFESTTEGIIITDKHGVVLAVNKAYCDITGYDEEEAVGCQPHRPHIDDQDEIFYQQIWAELQQQGHWCGQIWNQRKNGERYPLLLTIAAVADQQGAVENYVVVFTDITNIHSAMEQLEYQAHHHPLTGLPNRLLLNERLEQAIARSQRDGECGALLFVDLDNFKNINDSMGHAAGDRVLSEIARRLASNISRRDMVAHLSGDEFVLVKQPLESEQEVTDWAQQLLAELHAPFVVQGCELFISASIGISLFPADGVDAETLLKNADAAMYQAKGGGKNRYHRYSPDLTAAVQERVYLESFLRRVLEKQELVLHFQPQVDLTDGRVIAVETLVRWQHPELGLVPPDKFISLSEETGLIVPIGEWVLRTACETFMRLQRHGYGLKRIAVNLSGRQLQQDDLPRTVADILDQTGCPAEQLELEITESFIMQHPEQAIKVLSQIRSLGVELAVDDFGTGHSSLSYLKRLPLHRLKIDRSFVWDIAVNPEGEAITKAIIAMGQTLGMAITAEGIETDSQMALLKQQGCHEAQGFLISKPLPYDQLLSYLDHNQGKSEAALLPAAEVEP